MVKPKSNASDVPIPFLDLRSQYNEIREEIRSALDRVIESQGFILGPEVENFEKAFSTYSECDFAIGVSSGTDALLVSLMALGIKPGDEVIVPCYGFLATAGAIARLGARPVFVDIDPRRNSIDPKTLEAAVTPKTRAIIPVHLFGLMAEMDEIVEITKRKSVPLIEDAAQAVGARYNGKRAGAFGDFGCFSFFPSKNLGAFGDGGMVTTNDEVLADRVRVLRNHGFRRKHYSTVVGGNFRLDAIQAAVLQVKLGHLDNWTSRRQQNAATYGRLFKVSDFVSQSETTPSESNPIVLPADDDQSVHVYNQFVIRCLDRNNLVAHLTRQMIGTEVYYPLPLHLQECFSSLGYRQGQFPVSERMANECLALPVYPGLSEPMQKRIVTTIVDFYHR